MPHMVNVCIQSSRPLREAESNKAGLSSSTVLAGIHGCRPRRLFGATAPSQGSIQPLNVLKVSRPASADLLTSGSLGSITEGRGQSEPCGPAGAPGISRNQLRQKYLLYPIHSFTCSLSNCLSLSCFIASVHHKSKGVGETTTQTHTLEYTEHTLSCLKNINKLRLSHIQLLISLQQELQPDSSLTFHMFFFPLQTQWHAMWYTLFSGITAFRSMVKYSTQECDSGWSINKCLRIGKWSKGKYTPPQQ